MSDISIFLAFGAGFLSFISPCCLPLYPAFLSYITGVSLDQVKESNVLLRRNALIHTFFFLLGFSIIFVAIGFGTSILGKFFISYQDLIRQIGAIFITLLGFVIIGIYTPSFMMQEKRFVFSKKPSGYAGSSLIGMAYAAGWTPCTGPILVAVISLGATKPESAMMYMLLYILGFSIPFFVLSFFISKVHWINKYNHIIKNVGGYMMIIMGVILYFDWMTKIITSVTSLMGGFTGF